MNSYPRLRRDNQTQIAAVATLDTRLVKLQALRLAAFMAAHGTPNAELTFARDDTSRVHGTAIDRIADKGDAAVAHTDIHSAGMIRGGGNRSRLTGSGTGSQCLPNASRSVRGCDCGKERPFTEPDPPTAT